MIYMGKASRQSRMFAGIFVAVLLIGCQTVTPEKQIAGPWKDDKGYTWNFNGDGTLEIGDPAKVEMVVSRLKRARTKIERDGFQWAWKIRKATPYNQLDLELRSGPDLLATVKAIQDFTGNDSMRIGINERDSEIAPVNFDPPTTVADFSRK